ncbi:response regulator [Dyadobacter psychrophilus]|uniref:Response regulator receiver domain-containing protein n=1 Tax=Dyadobacter psychrophilus TaxID=651661 RepID=A0A1T5FQH6_9BACT|nr:response regulator [Dyadobacter psychrophilus]SKB98438.1 Response regulator receiver domain-containing protein [Dyadobacter psychrophilus]
MSSNKTLQILLADDDDDDAFLFHEALDQVSVKTDLVVAENGMRLMQILNKGDYKPDLIFLDMNMPVKNGLECLEEIKRLDGFDDVRVIILSTSVAKYMLDSAYENGANLYIQKPTSFSGLVDILKKCLYSKFRQDPLLGMEQFLITD